MHDETSKKELEIAVRFVAKYFNERNGVGELIVTPETLLEILIEFMDFVVSDGDEDDLSK